MMKVSYICDICGKPQDAGVMIYLESRYQYVDAGRKEDIIKYSEDLGFALFPLPGMF